MDQKRKKEKKWWQYLLVIPVMAVIDLLTLFAVGMADTAEDGVGHPLPALVFAAVMIVGAATVVLTVRAVILCIRAIIRARRGAETEEHGFEQSTAAVRQKKVWHCFIPLMIETPLALIAVIACGWWEISSFYNDPTHVGFAVPITTFALAGVCLLLTLVIAIACIIAAVVRSKKNRRS